jgi:hypothetical protein
MSDNKVIKGVFCDITGTLVSYEKGIDDIKINEDVVAFLRYMQEQKDADITLCSRIEDNAMAPISLKREFGGVAGKACYRSAILEYLIDNNPNPDEYLNAVYTIAPEQLKGFIELNMTERHKKFAELTGASPG